MKECTIQGCTRKAYYKESKLCKCCYAAFHYWQDATVTRLMRRSRQLGVFQARMDTMTGVRTLRRKAG